MHEYVIGIDPGQNGGLVMLHVGQLCTPFAFRMPKTERDIYEALYCAASQEPFVYIERVQAFPGQGVSSTFKFGRHYGFLRGVLIALELSFEEVSPQTWQRAMGCLSKGDKNVTKAKAQQLFPRHTITHAVADAFLIAEWGRRRMAGEKA